MSRGEAIGLAVSGAINSAVFSGFVTSQKCPASKKASLPELRGVYAAGLSTAIGSACMNWTDVCKVRMQMEMLIEKDASKRVYRSMLRTAGIITTQEGLWGLLGPGIVASSTRDIFYSGLRVGLYPIVKAVMIPDDGSDAGIARKMLAGCITGAIGSAIANPADLVKIRVHGEAGLVENGLLTTGLR